MSSMLSRFIRRRGKDLKNIAAKPGKYLGKGLGLMSMLSGFGGGGGIFSKLLGNMGGGGMAGQGGWYPGKYLGQMMGGGQGGVTYDAYGNPISEEGGGGGSIFQRMGQNFLGLDKGQAAAGGLGLGMQTLGGIGQMFAGPNKSYLNRMQNQLNPLRDAYTNIGDLSKQYLDPNSVINSQLRNQVRTQNMEGFADIADRQRNMSTGIFTPESSGAMNSNMMSDAIAKALGAHSSQLGESFKQGSTLAQSQGTLGNALAQAQAQNMMLAQQQGQLPWQYLGQTGTGLMNRALTA